MSSRAHVVTLVMLDPIVAAVGLPAVPGAAGTSLLADLSHHDPDHHPLVHARIWADIQRLGIYQVESSQPWARETASGVGAAGREMEFSG
jgi:hypothetical protein